MRKKSFGSMMFLLFFIFCSLACEKKNTEGSQTVDESLVVAKIGGTNITVKEFERKFNTIPPQYKMFFAGEEGKKKFLDEIIKEKVLAEKAKNMGIDSKDEVKAMINDIRDNILAKELFTSKNEELTKSINVTDEEVEKEIKTSETIARASHILVKDEAKAKDALKRVQKGEDFSKLASELSEDPSAKKNNGDLGTFSKGDMVPEFDKAIFALKIGEVTPEPVKTSFGFHVIKRTAPDKEEIKSRLLRTKQTTTLDSWLEEIKKEVATTVNEEVLGKIKLGGDEGAMPMGGMGGMPEGHGSKGKAGAMPAGHGGM